ncbi:transcription factor of the MADS box [Balamuthia mandrillaris]
MMADALVNKAKTEHDYEREDSEEEQGLDGNSKPSSPEGHHPPHVLGAPSIHMMTGQEDSDEEDEEIDRKGKADKPKGGIKKKPGGSGRRRIEIKFIDNKSRRQVTFSRRKRGLMKKAYELTTLTGTQALVLIASETGHVYTFATPKLQPVVTLREGKELIQSCLNAPDNNYAPSDFIANSSNSHNQQQQPQQQPQQQHKQQQPQSQPQQHSPHGGAQMSHNPHHDNMLNMYGGGMSPPPHGVPSHQSPYGGHPGGPHGGPPHMGGGYPHDMYLSGQATSLPPMSLGQHHGGMGHHDQPKREHHLS